LNNGFARLVLKVFLRFFMLFTPKSCGLYYYVVKTSSFSIY